MQLRIAKPANNATPAQAVPSVATPPPISSTQATDILLCAEGGLARALGKALGPIDKDRGGFSLELSQPQTLADLLGDLLIDRSQADTAEPLLLEGLRIRSEQLQAGDWHVAQTKATLGACYSALNRFEEAESLLLPAYQVMAAAKGADSLYALRAHQRIVSLYHVWSKPEKLSRWLASINSASK